MEPTVCFENSAQLAPCGIFIVIFWAVFAVFALATLVVSILLWAKIFGKAGYSKAFAFLLFAPFGQLILLCILAFGDWPILKDKPKDGSAVI